MNPANDHCTCAEIAGENPECVHHGIKAIIKKLRDLAMGRHSDISVAWDGAEMLESLWDDINPT